MGLLPWQFWKMTPGEFEDYAEGWSWREENRKRDIAWQTANLMNVWLKDKDRVTVEDLLKKEETKKGPMTDEQMANNAIAWAVALGATDPRKGAR